MFFTNYDTRKKIRSWRYNILRWNKYLQSYGQLPEQKRGVYLIWNALGQNVTLIIKEFSHFIADSK